MNLRTRIALIVASSVAVAVVAISGVTLFAARSQARSTLDDTLSERAAQLQVAASFIPSRGRGERPFGRFVPDDVLVQVIDADGRILEANVDPIPIGPDELDVARRNTSSHWADVEVDGVRLRVLIVPSGNHRAVMLARPLTEIEDSLGRLRNVLALVALLGVVGAGAVGFLVAGHAIRPVRKLTDAASAIAETQDLEHPIDVHRDDELGDLASSFNSMLGALDQSRRQQHRLVTDASHELRTPLTSLRTNVELMQRADELDPATRSEVMDDVLFELDELTALVSELVDLATDRGEMGEAEEIDLAVVVDAAVRRHRRRTDCDISANLEPCRVRAVPALVERAASNLIDNAVKWSPRGAPIEVVVRDGRLTVRDHGPGIPRQDWEAVFERFYRAESARSAPGSGLGLSIVQHVADTFGGDAAVVPTDGEGTTVMFELPVVAQETDPDGP
ncbi:MAG: HAMP domain-containing sensor histidine kinase, partial [Actinomycetota bacterium]|nr:HAMP domain-containing sensor histidine kinase [Actinomycetota bacterium]